MLKVEQHETTREERAAPLSYADYLRVPEIISLQTPLGPPDAHDEMLFIILQQVQELWFKQMLHELKSIIPLLDNGDIIEAVRLLSRVTAIVRVLGDEVGVMEMMPPQEFARFRHVLTPASGFESEQFRELEFASGLREPSFLKLIERHMDMTRVQAAWPVSLHEAFVSLLAKVDPEPVQALVQIYLKSNIYPLLFTLAEALSDYEIQFSIWRFRHVKLVERAIGDHMPGTAGSSGAGYLGKTLGYRFFPELWAARNALTRATQS